MRFPYCLTTNEEYEIYRSSYVDKGMVKCTNLTSAYIYLEEDGVKTSVFCPMLTAVYPEYFVKIQDLDVPNVFDNLKPGECPIAEQALGYKCKNLHPVCRFYKDPK
jgi:hypothetical protein